MKIKIKNARTGLIVDHDNTLPVPEGYGIVSSFLLMDSAVDDVQRAIASSRAPSRALVTDSLGREAGHRPGFVFARDNDEAEVRAQEAYLASKARLQDAWRGPSQFAAAAATWPSAWHNIHGQSPQPDERTRHDAAVAREAYKARLSSAWQTDAALPDRTTDARVSDSAASYAEMVRRVSNAWKTPAGAPR